ncbi:MAG: HWE histidine kinase domain-containing protein [Pseudomonadota bacterium]
MAARVSGEVDSDLLATRIGEALLGGPGGDGVLACDAAGRLTFCDEAGARFLKAGRRRMPGRDLCDLLSALGDQTLELRFRSALRDATPVEFVVARPAEDDEWVEVRGLPARDGMVFFLRDVTARERGERALRRKERRMRAANESLRLAHQAALAATWEWRHGGRMRWLDVAAARALIGLPVTLSEDEALADWQSFVVADDLPTLGAALATLPTRERTDVEFRVAAADGGYRWLRTSAAVVERRPDGAPARVVGVTLDITQHKLAEAKLQREVDERRRVEARQKLLIHELNHRVKNMLATVQSVARQSLGRLGAEAALADFEERLMALAWTHDILTREQWAGASLRNILERTMAPHGRGRVELDGADLRVSPKMALALAMGAHELATNAVKYGALSVDGGKVEITWRLDHRFEPPRLIVDWRELGGPRVTPPTRRGFGSRLLERGLAHELGGEVAIRYVSSGVRCRIVAPLAPEPQEPTDLHRETRPQDAVSH